MACAALAANAEPMAEPVPFASLDITSIEAILLDVAQPIEVRMSALFDARKVGDERAVRILIKALELDKHKPLPSILFEHEVAYVLGQIGNTAATEKLMHLLEDKTENEMVRHEAAEALAAIGSPAAVTCIHCFTNDASVPVKQTCELAYRSLLNKLEAVDGSSATTDATTATTQGNVYTSVDPVHALSHCTAKDIPFLQDCLRDSNAPLWDRYEALFTLRNIGTPDAIKAVADALVYDETSALLRHEVAFVLGQLQYAASASALIECLVNPDEHCMARHEAALALGAIGSSSGDDSVDARDTKEWKKLAVETLVKYEQENVDQVVKESCTVALHNIREELGVFSREDLLSYF